MPNKLIIDKSPYYTRCAVLLDGDLHEIHIMPRGNESVEGNIFVGRIETISKGIDAAFVNIGKKHNAFLYIDEKSNLTKLKCGQSLVVQALRDASKGKGIYITTNISFAGTYVVLFPDGNNGHIGISGKITDKNERQRLIDLVRPHIPEGSSVIVRTVAAGKTEEIIDDLKLVIKKMVSTLKYADAIKPPALIYEEQNFLEKIIRDTLGYHYSEIIVNHAAEYEKLRPFAESVNIPLSLHEGPVMLFDYYSVESKLRQLLDQKVWLKSGGFLIIDETEALVSIDVNTGKSKRRESTGETLFYSNLEAAKEIPRQLRLRNLSGIIVIDFIDMRSDEKREEILRVLREECEKDRNRTVVVGFTELGLALVTRKKTRTPISRTLLSSCNCIGGRRHSQAYVAFTIYMKIKKMLNNATRQQFRLSVEKSLKPYMEAGIADLEATYATEITLDVLPYAPYGSYQLD